MATKTILGTLLDASGVTPIGNATIRFVSTSTRSIINSITTDFHTSNTGAYNFNVLHGVYTIQIRRQEELQFRTICANVYIYDDIPESLELVIRAQGHVTDGTNPTTLAGYGITDAAPSSHVGATGTAHGVATTSVAGFMSSSDKTKLDGIAAGANAYTHPDSGVTAGTYRSVTVNARGHVTAGTNPTTLAGYGITDAQPKDTTITALAGVTTAADKMIYATAPDVFTTTSITPFARTLIDDVDAATMRTTLGIDGLSVNDLRDELEPRISNNESKVFEALRRSYADAGLNLVDGSFEAGGTLVNANDVLLQECTGKAFSGPAGPVSAGTNPAGDGFVDRSGKTLTYAHLVLSKSITPSGATAILDLANAALFRVTLTEHITQIGFTNALGEEGSSRSVTLILRQGTGVNLVSWPENIRWAYGHLPVLSYEKDAEDYITLVRFGADAHWYGFLIGGGFHV